MQVYELGYLILPSIAEDKLPAVVDAIKGVVSKEGGNNLDGEAPLKYDLAYTMTKTVGASRYVVNEAYVGWQKFDLPVEALAKEGGEHPVNRIKDKLEKMDEILRFIIIKAPRKTTFTFADAMKKLEAEPVSIEDSGVTKEVSGELELAVE